MEEFEKRIFRAEISDKDEILKIYSCARKFMLSQGNPQWEKAYPDADYLRTNIAKGNIYLVKTDGEIAAVFSVFEGDFEYDSLPSAWLTSGNYLAVHTVAVSDKYRNRGIARYILSYACDYARSLGKGSIRMDTGEFNLPMRNLLQSCGFVLCGRMNGEEGRMIYEKIL